MNILIDAGLLICLCDHRDQYHKKSIKILEKIRLFNLYLPWPVSYEALRTRGVENTRYVRNLKKYDRDLDFEFIDDAPYRESAFRQAIRSSLMGRPISMVDIILRFIMDKEHIKVDYLATFNIGDFQAVCKRRNIPIIM